MVAVRLPLAVSSSALIGIAMFWGLWFLVSAPIDIGDRIEARRIDKFTRPAIPPPQPTPPPPTLTILPPLPPVPGGRGLDIDPPTVRATPTAVSLTPVFTGRGFTPEVTLPTGADRDAIPVVRPDPVYPRRALIDGTEGWVRVQFSITATGGVADATVVDASPAGVFDAEALKAIARWRYEPKVVDGMPVERVGLQTIIRFEVKD